MSGNEQSGGKSYWDEVFRKLTQDKSAEQDQGDDALKLQKLWKYNERTQKHGWDESLVKIHEKKDVGFLKRAGSWAGTGWDIVFDGAFRKPISDVGDTSVCSVYDDAARKYPNCSYYKEASDICRGDNVFVNSAVVAGIADANKRGANLEIPKVLTGMRNGIANGTERFIKMGLVNPYTGCVPSIPIHDLHDDVFVGLGIDPRFYGGHMWFDGVWPNPVVDDEKMFLNGYGKPK